MVITFLTFNFTFDFEMTMTLSPRNFTSSSQIETGKRLLSIRAQNSNDVYMT